MKIRKYFGLLVILIILIISFLLYLKRYSLINSDKNVNPAAKPLFKNQSKKSTVKIGDLEIKVDISDTVKLQTRGLSGRSNLDEEEGMLFIFPDEEVRYFWMKDMIFPIDIIWIDKGGTIIGIVKDAAKPEGDIPDYKLHIYTSFEPVSYVLEVNAGFSDRHNIKVYDIVQINQ